MITAALFVGWLWLIFAFGIYFATRELKLSIVYRLSLSAILALPVCFLGGTWLVLRESQKGKRRHA